MAKSKSVRPVGKKKVTSEAERAYLKAKGTICLYCQSKDVLSYGCPQVDGDVVTMSTHCGNCNKEWKDLYRLTGILEED